ncbi:MAG TPA: carboxypeptidase-like regulatory domain-containing protein [Vicinamibacterales bacterium]|jgi:protocatechuate 3,4-dioxygenase beta subunit|nr:carboxypeptidase-like regulatory domain-containing protein [Vicinamibacterales bacterium]
MSRRTPAGAIALLAIGLAGFKVDAQVSPTRQPFAPGSPRGGSQAAGTAVIRGRVTDGDSGQPLRRALVRVIAPGLRDNRVATTDEQGRWELIDLPAGSYIVSASKGNYVGLQFGQARPTDAGRPIVLLDGQTVEKVDFSLRRGGVITGHVLDEYGDPVPNVQVAALRAQFVQGRLRLTPAARFSTTDDLGEYRVFGLTPADYYVGATYRPPPPSAADDDAPGYAVTYSPGTVNPSDAQRVTLGVGLTVDGVNVALVPARLAQITGTAMNSSGQPMAGAFVMVTEKNNALGNGGGAQVRPDGTFTLLAVAPGEYILRAQGPFTQNARPEIATATVTVAGQNIDGVRLVVEAASWAVGTVLVDPAAAAAFKGSSIALTVTPVDPPMSFIDTSAHVQDDFTFEAAVHAGINIVRLIGMPNDVAMKAVRVGGVDVTDGGFDVKPGEIVRGIEVELTSHPTVVSGQVADSRGAPAKDCTVVIFARDERKWEGASRYVRQTRSDQDGQFRISGLPPGDYHAAAVDGFQQLDLAGDPDVLKQIRDRAAGFSLGEGETKVIDLKVTR